MTTSALEARATALRAGLVRDLADRGFLADPAWREAVEQTPRHRFVPGFYLPAEAPSPDGLTVWEPVTAGSDPDRWLESAYRDVTLMTQFDNADEPDWEHPRTHTGGVPTSSATLPSLVARMWADGDLRDGDRVLEIGTGTGYSTALACERLGSDAVASIEVDPSRLAQAAGALADCGYGPTLAVADGLYGYYPAAPFDRIVAALSVRAVPSPWLDQIKPGGKILTTLGGWLHGYARVLLTSSGQDAEGHLLPGTISFMPARAQEPPNVGNPSHWTAMHEGPARPARHAPDRITAATAEAFHARFLVQCAVPTTQLVRAERFTHLIDVVTGSVATLEPGADGWQVRETGPAKLWHHVEEVLDNFDRAERPGPEAFTLRIAGPDQVLSAPGMELYIRSH